MGRVPGGAKWETETKKRSRKDGRAGKKFAKSSEVVPERVGKVMNNTPDSRESHLKRNALHKKFVWGGGVVEEGVEGKRFKAQKV